MANYGGFYKGDKKKPKKNKLEDLAKRVESGSQAWVSSSEFVPPQIIPKGKIKPS